MSKKIKEIDVWVNVPDDLDYSNNIEDFCIDNAPYDEEFYNCYKAKLIIEIPEQKIEITESQFDKAVALYDYQCGSFRSYQDLVSHLKEQLGFTE